MVTKGSKWYWEHRDEQIKKNREWKLKNREQMLKQKKDYYKKNIDIILKKKKEYRQKNQDKIKAYRQRETTKQRERIHTAKYRKNNPDKIKEYNETHKDRIEAYRKEYQQRPEVKLRRAEQTRLRRKSNPQSNRRGSIDLQLAMNNVRKRDNNTCQWQGCNKTFRETPIHVHHIFPVSEYPDFELIEQYMICYCANHHGLWHRFRGDKYSEMIPARYQEDQLTTLRGRD